MWARDFEMALALWLGAAPLVFRHAGAESWAVDLACAAIVVGLGLVSYTRRARRAHLGTLAIAVGLMAYGWASSSVHDPLPAHQNRIVVGFLLAMLAIVPTRASLPPEPWRGGP